MAAHKQWHVAGWPAILLIPIAIPILLLIELAGRLGLVKTSADLTAEDVRNYLQNCLDGKDSGWDWDDFTSIRITDPHLDQIRQDALDLTLPLDHEGRSRLNALIERTCTQTTDVTQESTPSASPSRARSPAPRR